MARSRSPPPARSRPAWSSSGSGSRDSRPSSPPPTRCARRDRSGPGDPLPSRSGSWGAPFHDTYRLALAARDGLGRHDDDLRIEAQVGAQELTDPCGQRRPGVAARLEGPPPLDRLGGGLDLYGDAREALATIHHELIVRRELG